MDDKKIRFNSVGSVPDKPGEGRTPEQAARLAAALTRADELGAHSLGRETTKAYGVGVRRYAAWCKGIGAPAFPSSPARLASYVAAHALLLGPDGEAVPDGDGWARGPLSPASLAQHVSAVDKAHVAEGAGLGWCAPPGRSPEVRGVLRGAQRLFPPGEPRNTPIDAALLRRMLEAPSPGRAGDLLLLVLCSAGLAASAIVALDVADVTAERGALLVGPGPRRLRIPADALPVPATALVAGLPGHGPAFTHSSGRSYTRQGIEARVRRVAGQARLAWPQGRGLPRWAPEALAEAAGVLTAPGADPRGDRDRSLVVTVYVHALRPESPQWVQWRDTAEYPGDHPVPPVVVHLCREKNDRRRLGARLALESTGNPRTGPAELAGAWHACATAQLGGDPRLVAPGQPVWYALNRDGTPVRDPRTGALAGLGPDAVEAVVRRLLRAAGADPGLYTGGSMRSGVSTALSVAGAPAQDLMALTRRAALDSLLRYVRPVPGTVGTARRLGL